MDKVLPFARNRRRPDPARVAEFAETAKRLQRERDEYGEVVRRALRETPRTQWSSIPNLATSGALEQLSKEVEARLDSVPREALAVAELATEVAAKLTAYPAIVIAQLRAQAWRDRGQALTYLSRYDDALRAIGRAEAELEAFGTLAHDLSVVHFVRATALQHLRRFDEAQALLDECREVFRAHGDVRLYSMCTLAAGNLLVRRGDHAGAREMFAPLAGDSTERDAIVQIALGWCAIHLDDPHDALSRFETAESLFLRFNRELSALRASYGVGSALLRLGNVDLAVNQLDSVRDRFLSHKLIEEAGLSGLELVEAHLLQHDTGRAKTLSATIVREFAEAGLNRRAVAALAYLNEAISASSATPEIVRNVHSFISALRTDPAREFAVN
jgi:tetratricopeptide (TPR) repeat protein